MSKAAGFSAAFFVTAQRLREKFGVVWRHHCHTTPSTLQQQVYPIGYPFLIF
jgi:hypothetical protein